MAAFDLQTFADWLRLAGQSSSETDRICDKLRANGGVPRSHDYRLGSIDRASAHELQPRPSQFSLVAAAGRTMRPATDFKVLI